MACPISAQDIRVVSETYKFWITKTLIFKFDDTVDALHAVAALLPPAQTIKAALAYLDHIKSDKSYPRDDQVQALSNHLRNTALAMFPTPSDFVTFCTTTKVSERGRQVDPISYIWVAIVYLSSCASSVNSASMMPNPTVTWESIASQMDLSTNFGAALTPHMSGYKGTHKSIVDAELSWVGHIVDMAVRLQKWDRTGNNAPVDAWVRVLSTFIGLPI